jgi:RNase adaptor protein for sRNA GlmZ degradation
MESEDQNDANIRDFVKEDIEQADMPNEIRRYLDEEMINFRRDTKTRNLFGI